jgi:hypothetical protein
MTSPPGSATLALGYVQADDATSRAGWPRCWPSTRPRCARAPEGPPSQAVRAAPAAAARAPCYGERGAPRAAARQLQIVRS